MASLGPNELIPKERLHGLSPNDFFTYHGCGATFISYFCSLAHCAPGNVGYFEGVIFKRIVQNSCLGYRCEIAPRSIQCKPDISRLVGSMERDRDISGSAIYRATAMSQNPGQVFQRVVSGDGAFVCLAANSTRRQRIPWHLSNFDVALQNRVVEFQTKAVCA